MRISYVRVKNYRNINGIEVVFNPECNYIIGENNLGKSNFLALLTTICNGRGFDERDFADPQKAIEVELRLRLLENEMGFFDDNFDPEDARVLNIRYYQTVRDAYPSIVSMNTQETLPLRKMNKINFLKYETTSIPSKELRVDTQKGVGLLISKIIEQFNDEAEPAFLNNIEVNRLIEHINEYLSKIRSFRDYSIKATISPNTIEMLTNLLYLSDGVRTIDTT